MLAKNVAHVITSVHTGYHKKKKTDSFNQPIQKTSIHAPIKVLGSLKSYFYFNFN